MRRNSKESLKRSLVGYCTKATIFLIMIYIVIQFFIGGSITPSRQTVRDKMKEKTSRISTGTGTGTGTGTRKSELHSRSFAANQQSGNDIGTGTGTGIAKTMHEKIVGSTITTDHSENVEERELNHLLLDYSSRSRNREESYVPCPFSDSPALLEAMKRKGISVTTIQDSSIIEYNVHFDTGSNPDNNDDMKYIHICIDEGKLSDNNKFHNIHLRLTSTTAHDPYAHSNSNYDCDMYLSASNSYPSPILSLSTDSNSESESEIGNQALIRSGSRYTSSWDWKSNDVGEDTISLFTYMPEFHSDKTPDKAWFQSIPVIQYKDLFIGIHNKNRNEFVKKESSDKILNTCTLRISIRRVDRNSIVKKLNLRGNGQVVMPRDIQ